MKKALVVVDMQRDFIDGALGTKEAEAIVPGVVAKIKGFDGEIIFTQDTHFEDYLDTQEGKRLPVKHCIKGTPGWEIPEEILAAAAGKKIEFFLKTTFGSAELGTYAVKSDFDRMELVGLCTDICVISNAMLLKAFCPEMEIAVDGSCCAGVTPESHATALRAMEACQIQVEAD
ncbi:isochorismatase family cysteine hydrolase [Clostridium sp. AN503]|uniref:cysteine hydrolase family protein n=1 Tax=Clostridium sp. AN503 TaxID=3160598 RepID=UPI00345A9ECF